MTTITEAFDVYDYMREKCRKNGPWTETIGIKEWLERSLVIGGLYVFRPKKRIQAIMIGWPVSELPQEGDEPQYDPQGEIFYCKFRHGAMKEEDMDRHLAQMAMERHPFVTKFCFMEYDEEGKPTSRLLELAQELVNG